jgi:hypothetical protein
VDVSSGISCRDSQFRVAKPEAALRVLKIANAKEPLFDFDEIPQQVAAASTLAEALTACGWDVEPDENEQIARLFYEGNLLTSFDDIERLFTILARYVDPSSYLVIEGDDELCLRYTFEGGRLQIDES